MVKLLTIPQAARLLRMHPESIRRMVRRGVLPDRRPPGARKIMLYATDLIRPTPGDTTDLAHV